jgi:TolA-binding protein
MTHYRLGQANYALKKYAKAEEHFLASVKANGNKGAKSNLSRLRKAKKEGRIKY